MNIRSIRRGGVIGRVARHLSMSAEHRGRTKWTRAWVMPERAPSKDHEEAAMQPQMEHWWVVQDSVLVMS